MGFVNLLNNDIWSEADLTNRMRAFISSHVSEQRQSDLQTIMIGHIAQLRKATDAELAEIMLVKKITESAGDMIRMARVDMELLNKVMKYEDALNRLSLEPIDPTEQDIIERGALTSLVDTVTQNVLDVYLLRNPVVNDILEKEFL